MLSSSDHIIAETDRLILRHLLTTDGEALDHIFGDPQVMLYGDGVQSPQWVREWLRGYIENHYEAWGFGIWAVVLKASREVIGYCGLSRFPHRCEPHAAEIGYRLARAHWGRGLATEAVLAVRDYALHVLHVPRLIAIIDPHNIASLRVAEKTGFRYERDIMFEGYTHPDGLYVIERDARATTS
jgi:ribosomal-protein-alanine N-acetyltransferase